MKQYEIVLESRAKDDLTIRYRWLMQTASLEAAEDWLNGIAEAVQSLSALPERCPIAPEDDALPVSVRQILTRSDRILFTVSAETDTVHVLHVRHQARRYWVR